MKLLYINTVDWDDLGSPDQPGIDPLQPNQGRHLAAFGI